MNWAKKAMIRDLTNTSGEVTLYEHKFLDGNGKPHTAFVAATEAQWQDFEKKGATDLHSLKDSIVLLVEGLEPSHQDKLSANRMFGNLYASVTPTRHNK